MDGPDERGEPRARDDAGERNAVAVRDAPGPAGASVASDDPRWEAGMPVLDRQTVRERPTLAQLAAMAPRSVPETAPTPLQRQYINLSAVALILGVIAISALELGSSLSSPLVKVCVAVAGPILLLTTGDATLRIARSARAWMAVDPGRGWFRVAWVAASVVLLAVILAAMVVVLRA